MKTYTVCVERREIYRELVTVTSEHDSPNEACELALEQMEEHDWTDNTLCHVEEVIVMAKEHQ